MLKVALTGGIASGKTAVSNLFEALGVPVIDADLLSRQAVAPGSVGLELVVNRFGEEVLDTEGSLDRAALRKIVFSDKMARTDLEAIIHPEVRRLTTDAIEQHSAAGADYCLVVIPLLVETQQQNKYDHVIVVDVSEETQIRRVMQRDDSTEDQAKKILSSQATRDQRLAVADTVIDNSGSMQALEVQVNAVHQELLSLG